MSNPNIDINVSGPKQASSTYKTIVLKGNQDFASQIYGKTNHKFVIKYDFDLGGDEVTIPANCVLEFEGGSLSNGTIVGQNTTIVAENYKIFSTTVNLLGSWNNYMNIQWFGAKSCIDTLIDSSEAIQCCFNQSIQNIYIPTGNYYIQNTIHVNKDKNIIFEGYAEKIAENALLSLSENRKCGILFTDKNINVLEIDTEKLRVKSQYIKGGCIDVSLCDNYTKNAIIFTDTLYGAYNRYWSIYIDTTIRNKNNYTGTAIRFKFSNGGYAQMVHIASIIEGFEYGIVDDIEGAESYTTDLKFTGETVCVQAININRFSHSEILGSVQAVYLNEDNQTAQCYINSNSCFINSVFWDINNYKNNLRTNRFAIEFGPDVNVAKVGDNVKVLNNNYLNYIKRNEVIIWNDNTLGGTINTNSVPLLGYSPIDNILINDNSFDWNFQTSEGVDITYSDSLFSTKSDNVCRINFTGNDPDNMWCKLRINFVKSTPLTAFGFCLAAASVYFCSFKRATIKYISKNNENETIIDEKEFITDNKTPTGLVPWIHYITRTSVDAIELYLDKVNIPEDVSYLYTVLSSVFALGGNNLVSSKTKFLTTDGKGIIPRNNNGVICDDFTIKRSGVIADLPITKVTGLKYFDTSINSPIYFNNYKWVNVLGLSPARFKGTTPLRPIAALGVNTGTTGISGSVNPTDTAILYNGFTFYNTTEQKYYICKIVGSTVNWKEEGASGSGTWVVEDVDRSGPNNSMPLITEVPLYNGFEYYNTTYRWPYYVISCKKIAENQYQIEWAPRIYNTEILNSLDTGFPYYDTTLGKLIFAKNIALSGVITWCEYDGAKAGVLRSGTFANKPAAADIYVGFKYFCTDKQTAEGATDGIEIIHKGSGVWVDALGRVVS